MKKGLIVLVAMFLPMSLFGSTELIYAWGYGSPLNEALQALKGLTSEADYIIKTALAIAVLVFSISKALDSKSSPVWEIGKLVLMYGIVYHFFLSPSNNTYVIYDEVTNKDYKVSNLPSGLGNTFSLMSRLEKVILDGMEKHYSTPNSIAYSKAGLGFSLNAMMDIPSLRPASNGYINLQTNMDLYIRNCLQYNTLSRVIDMKDVTTSSELANILFRTNDGKVGVYIDTNTKTKSLMNCGDIATNLRRDFESAANDLLIISGNKAGLGTLTEYTNNFENAMSLYFGQAVGAREQFQQALVMNSLDDGILNTAKMLGLNAQSLAANTAIADQTITTSMQSQGRLAQTYLPLAKAYMTIIVISVSWLMAIISIIFGSYTHIKMFFTLCLSMVLWTPILSIINFLNDLNIQSVFADLVLKNDGALTYTNFKEVIQKVTENSNFLKYLVMLTPMLAYALAKGSEMGFVSIASSLSQQLAGASRAASSFATQQALSTSTAITTPKGDEVYAREAGINSHKSAFYDGSGNLTSSNTQTDGYGGTANSAISNAVMSGTNVGGSMQGAKLSNAAIESLNGYSKQLQENYNTNFQDALNRLDSQGRQSIFKTANSFMEGANEQQRQAYSQNFVNEVMNNESLSTNQKAKIVAHAAMSGRISASAGFKIAGNGVSAETAAEVGTRVESLMEAGKTISLDTKSASAFQSAHEISSIQTWSQSHGSDASQVHNVGYQNTDALSKIISHGHSYAEAQNSVQSVKSDDLNNLMNGVAGGMAANDGASWNSLSTAQQDRYFANAGSMISDMAQNNPAALQSLQKELGAGMTTQGQMGSTRAEGYGFKSMRYDDAAINYDNGKNIDALNTQAKSAKTIQNTPNEQDLEAQQNIKAKEVANLYKGQSVFGGVYKAIHGEDSKYPNLIKR